MGADLFASLLRIFPVRLGLPCSVDGGLFVDLEHLHLFLDGVHGCLSVVEGCPPRKARRKVKERDPERLIHAERPAGVRAASWRV